MAAMKLQGLNLLLHVNNTKDCDILSDLIREKTIECEKVLRDGIENQ